MQARLAHEVRLLYAAGILLTRVPLPAATLPPDWLPRAAKYLPLVGALVGLAGAFVLVAGSAIWPPPIPQLLALAATMLLTGALHEDGLADTFDALGGTTREARLAILKDSRLGTFGALALIVCVVLQIAALTFAPIGLAALAFVAANAGGRATAVAVMALSPYAASLETAKVAGSPGRPTTGEVAIAIAIAVAALLPVFVSAPQPAATALLLGLVAGGAIAWRACGALGGHTGDVLGATSVAFQTGFFLGAAAVVPGGAIA